MVTAKLAADTESNPSEAPPSINIQGVRQELWSATDSDVHNEHIWGDTGSRQQSQMGNEGPNRDDVPPSLRPGSKGRTPFDTEEEINPWEDSGKDARKPKVTLEHAPTVLRPGGKLETNPFKRKPVNSSHSPTSPRTPEPTTSVPPTDTFSQLRVEDSESSTNPWEPAVEQPKSSLAPARIPSVGTQDDGNEAWASAPSREPPAPPSSTSPALVSLPSGTQSPAWDELEPPKASLPSMPQKSPEEQQFSQDAHAWDDLGSLDKGKAPATSQTHGTTGASEGWNLIDHETVPGPASISRQSTWENFADAEDTTKETAPPGPPPSHQPAIVEPGQRAPSLPPRRASEAVPAQTTESTQATQPSPPSADPASKSETYQIKNINWIDVTAGSNTRKSPILVQNANGPCPLVALVNALTLTTPANLTNTVLVETLRSREQISLNLLLEAVFDELMSPRRTKPDAALPDVTELYAFLKSLHTGMNVNPRYVPTAELITAYKRTSLSHVHPSERGDFIPGTFEDTRDMKLYATFSVPLIHGWLPPKDDPAYDAFARQAASYDEAQNLMFREEELEDKFSNSSSGLAQSEQQMYQDILTIKSWLNVSATQLTPWGLQVITKAIEPGAFSILFRNDHFSTLYRHPQTQQLFTLVTDAGYYTHDEIVWESLVDVNGERADFFSGDFRLVGGAQQEQAPDNWYDDAGSASAQVGGEWQTVQSRRGRGQEEMPASPMSANHEQEDRDLALALQLQEEEDERHREEQEARRRESQLTEQYLEQQGRGTTARTGPRGRGGSRGGIAPARGSSISINVPVRGGGNSARGARPAQQVVRPLVPPLTTTPATTTHRPNNGEDEDAPPSYEQASKATPYVPPAGHPNHPTSSPSIATNARRRPTVGSSSGPSAQSPAQSSPSPGPGPGPNSFPATGVPMGRGRGTPVAPPGQSFGNGRDRDCIVM